MSKEKSKNETIFFCPMGRFFLEIKREPGITSRFLEHLSRREIGFWKTVRSKVDARIEALEKEGTKKEGKKKEKIEVE